MKHLFRNYQMSLDPFANGVNVSAGGAVLLGANTSCDGFKTGRSVRVQSHVHEDHMKDFDRSKQFQSIYATRATRDLLIAERNADLPYRNNFIGLEYNKRVVMPGGEFLTLIPSGHMLGAAQILIERPDGLRIAYSGDFAWPLKEAVRADILVVDSTYATGLGGPRRFTQADADLALLELVSQKLRKGPVYLTGFRGVLHRAAEIICNGLCVSLIASDRFRRQAEVYQAHGRPIPTPYVTGDEQYAAYIENGRYVVALLPGERIPETNEGTSIQLTAYLASRKEPVREWSSRSYSVAISDHADFEGTLSYVQATGARAVVTDNTRGKAVELAIEISTRLGISAVASNDPASNDWGA